MIGRGMDATHRIVVCPDCDRPLAWVPRHFTLRVHKLAPTAQDGVTCRCGARLMLTVTEHADAPGAA